MKFLKSTPLYVVVYLLFMGPTYILPYFGSNSTLINSASMVMGFGFTPMWWAHTWCFLVLASVTWVRGGMISKGYLPLFPVLAGVFDMAPFLNFIPLIPTSMHLVALIVGGIAKEPQESEAIDKRAEQGVRNVLAATALAIVGAVYPLAVAKVMVNHAAGFVDDTPSPALHSPSHWWLPKPSSPAPEGKTVETNAVQNPSLSVPAITKTPTKPMASSVLVVSHKSANDGMRYQTLDQVNAAIDRVDANRR